MKAVLKIEFQRLFRSVTFYISLGIGLILTMTQFVMQDRRWCTARFII